MNALHIRKVIDSETLYLPELKPFVGKTVEIIVRESSSEWLPHFWERLAQGWQGEALVRPEQGRCDARDAWR